jgi:signal transduction histidine kinase
MTDDLDHFKDKLNPEQLDKLYKRHRQGAFVRAGASFFMWLFAFVAYLFDGIQKDHIIGVSFCVVYLILINPPTLWILQRITHKKFYQKISVFINFLEVIGYTAIIYALGGIKSLYLSPIYCALIAYVGTVGPSRLPFTIATLCSATLSLMVGLEHFGYIPHQAPLRGLSLPGISQLTMLLVNISLLYVVAFITSYTGGLLRKNKTMLREQNTELERSREKLKMAADKLEEKNVKLKMALGKARESDRMKSEFLANMSHELRTPLNHIIGFTELVTDKKIGALNEMQEEYLNDALHSSKHLLTLINDVLDLSKVEAGKLQLQLSEVNLKMLLKNSLNVFTEEVMKRKIQLSSQINGIPEIISADERRLKQILYNLLSNAVKFTPDGGEIRLTANLADHSLPIANFSDKEASDRIPEDRMQELKNLGKFVAISVIDNGIGIDPDNMERVFHVFEQVETSASRKYQGTGLGLPLTKQLVELHGGKIWAESDGEGKGSAFGFAIPTDLKPIEA